MSSVYKDNSNIIVKSLGQVLPYCLSGENISVDGCKCYIAQEKKRKKYKPEWNICVFPFGFSSWSSMSKF